MAHISVLMSLVTNKFRIMVVKGWQLSMLAGCDINMNFTYVLSVGEGPTTDKCVLVDTPARPNGLRVP